MREDIGGVEIREGGPVSGFEEVLELHSGGL